MGSGHNRLLLYTHEGKAWVRAAGTWDPMPWHLDKAYKIAGSEAQHAFWGQGDDEALSLLHQLARAARRRERRRRHRRGPERARGRDPARRGRALGARARGRRRARRRRAHRGADAPRLPPRHVLLRLPGGRRVAGVRPHAAGEHGLEWVHPDACYAHPLPGGEAALLYRDRARRCPARDGERWLRVRAPFLDHFDAVRDTMLSGFPPVGGPLRLGPEAAGRARAAAARLGGRAREAAVRARRVARVAVRRGDARRHAAGRRRLRDRRVLPEPARPRRRLAEPARRRRAPHRRARRATCARSAARSAPARGSSAS